MPAVTGRKRKRGPQRGPRLLQAVTDGLESSTRLLCVFDVTTVGFVGFGLNFLVGLERFQRE